MKRSMATIFTICLGISMFVLTAIPAGAENTVKGKLTVDGKTVEIKHVLAYSQPGFFDKKKKDVVVLMCDAPVTQEVAKDPFGVSDQAKAGKLHCVRHTIDADKKVISFEVNHNRFKMTVSGGSTYQIFEPKTFTSTAVAGRSRTTAPQKSGFDDVPYSYDITFSADIAAPQSKKVGTKLPADGGDAWKAYIAHNKKVKSMDIKEIRKTMPKEESDKITDKELKAMKELAVAMMAKNPKFSEGYLNGDKGMLFITDHSGKEKRYGTIDMTKENDKWVVGKESWSDNPPE
ncbi:MAG: hypothetical protein C0402_08455 [Thermodesulfovibrio sp.]|nr:hypothetical protein [Thermodesulfovibrio sp.]